MLGLLMKLSSILLQLRGNSSLTLLDDVKLTVIDHSVSIIFFNHHIKTVNHIHKIRTKVVGVNVFIWKISKE